MYGWTDQATDPRCIRQKQRLGPAVSNKTSEQAAMTCIIVVYEAKTVKSSPAQNGDSSRCRWCW
jgi:hypothetical protein